MSRLPPLMTGNTKQSNVIQVFYLPREKVIITGDCMYGRTTHVWYVAKAAVPILLLTPEIAVGPKRLRLQPFSKLGATFWT